MASQCDNIKSNIEHHHFVFRSIFLCYAAIVLTFECLSAFFLHFPIAELKRIALSSNAFSGSFLFYGFLLCPYNTFTLHTHHVVCHAVCRLHTNNSCTKWNCFRIANQQMCRWMNAKGEKLFCVCDDKSSMLFTLYIAFVEQVDLVIRRYFVFLSYMFYV